MENLPILQDKKYLKVILDFANDELDLLPTLNDIAAKYMCFIEDGDDGERYSFTMLDEHVAVMLKETKEKILLMSKVVTILSDTFEQQEYLMPDYED